MFEKIRVAQSNLMNAAVEVSLGRYATKSPTSGAWLITDSVGLAAIQDPNAKPGKYTVMPAWWSPDQRFAWIGPVDSMHPKNASVLLAKGATFSGHLYLSSPACRNESPSLYRRITADLDTGAEAAADADLKAARRITRKEENKP